MFFFSPPSLSLSSSFLHLFSSSSYHKHLLPALRPVEATGLHGVHHQVDVVEVPPAHRAAEEDEDVGGGVQDQGLGESRLDLALLRDRRRRRRCRRCRRRRRRVDVRVGIHAGSTALGLGQAPLGPRDAASAAIEPQRGLLGLKPLADAGGELRGRRGDIGDEARGGEREAHGLDAGVGVATVVVVPGVGWEGEEREEKKR